MADLSGCGEPMLNPAGAQRIVVTGPPLAGVGAVVGVLRARLPGHRVTEGRGGDPGGPADAVVFVVSAAAPMTGSQAEILDAAVMAGDGTGIVAAVSKVDVHRGWRAVLEANRAALIGRAPDYAGVVWVGVAAQPDVGPERTDDLVRAVRAVTGRPRRTRQTPTRLPQLRRARLELAGQIRAQCAALRAELQSRAAELPARHREEFADHVRQRVAAVRADLDRAADRWLGCPAGAAPPAEYPPPPTRPELENRLTMLLGGGFGLGVALTAGRVIADLAPRWAPAAVLACSAAGLALACWVVRTRRLLAERAALDRWVVEVTAALRMATQQEVAGRLLAAETADTAGFGHPRGPR